MSNPLSVAATTAALAYRLTQAMSEHGFAGGASPGRPPDKDAVVSDPAIKVFLYRVEPDASRRNEDLPSRSGSALTERPRMALRLHYLLVFLGSEDLVVPDLLLGIAATSVNARPVLTAQEIEAGWTTEIADGRTQDLSSAPERVRLSILGLGLEDLSHLWSSLMNQPYRPSLTVTADLVVLEPDLDPVRPVPVTTRRLVSSVVLTPEIRVAAVAGAERGVPAPIVAGAQLELRGRDLRGEETTVVLVGDAEVSPDGPASASPAPTATSERVVVTLPTDTPPGVIGIAIEHRLAAAAPPSPRLIRRSPLFPVVVVPVITSASLSGVTGSGAAPPLFAGTVDIVLAQPVPDEQPVAVHLNGAGRAFAFTQATRSSAPATSTTTLAIPFAEVPAGEYLVRVVISGAASVPTVATTGTDRGTITGPRVTVA
jgi:hypothetical protein